MDNFWKRYNKVALDKLALDKEKQSLMVENQQLRTLLKQYLDGISVNDEILSQVNPLFIINDRTNLKSVLMIFLLSDLIIYSTYTMWKISS